MKVASELVDTVAHRRGQFQDRPVLVIASLRHARCGHQVAGCWNGQTRTAEKYKAVSLDATEQARDGIRGEDHASLYFI
jgi:hypothetical protein